MRKKVRAISDFSIAVCLDHFLDERMRKSRKVITSVKSGRRKYKSDWAIVVHGSGDHGEDEAETASFFAVDDVYLDVDGYTATAST